MYKDSHKSQLKGIKPHSSVSEPPHLDSMHASFFTARLVALAAIASVVSGQSGNNLLLLQGSIMLTTAKRLVLPAGCDRNVTVRAGDTCDAISAANSVSTYV